MCDREAEARICETLTASMLVVHLEWPIPILRAADVLNKVCHRLLAPVERRTVDGCPLTRGGPAARGRGIWRSLCRWASSG